ncbi:MAG: hypothetical protein ACYTG7_17860, partial [Planctomycetota bacterium]
MSRPVHRRDFIKSTLLQTSAGCIALDQLIKPNMLAKGFDFLVKEKKKPGHSICVIEPATLPCGAEPATFTLTYTAGLGSLPAGWSLCIRCPSPIEDPVTQLTWETSCPHFEPHVQVKQNIGISRIIWVDTGPTPLPKGETLTITVKDHVRPRTPVRSVFSVVEVDPDGKEPEIGSGLTFQEVYTEGGKIVPHATESFHVVLPAMAMVSEPIRIRIAALDGELNATPLFTGSVSLESNIPLLELPESVEILPEDKGSKTILV